MAQSLEEAAKTGDINGLYDSIKEDPNVLDLIDAIPFVHTPLHIAASAGHADFAIEILRLKPSLGRKLNRDGLSSLHLALINDKFETAKRLVKFDKELIRVKGREGANSLHLIAKRDNNSDQQQIVAGRIDILAEFLFACPNSIEDLTIRDETPLHIAVKSNNQKAVDVILGCIRRIKGKRVLLNYKDKEGKTALCMAMASSQIARSLRSTGARKSSSPGPSLAEFLDSPERFSERFFKFSFCLRRSVSMELRNIVFVVAALIATATFQAILSPPGGVGGPGDNSLFTNGSNINATVSSTNNLFAGNTSFINATLSVPSEDPVKRLLFNGGGAKPGFVTRVFLGDGTYGSIFYQFYLFNTLAFLLSMLMIMFVLPILPFFILHAALYALMVGYGFSFPLISPSDVYSLYFMVPSSVCAVLIFAARSATATYAILTNKVLNKHRFQMLEDLMMNSVGQ